MTAAHTEHTGPSLGPVVLDIGGDVGAAVVVAPVRLDGLEIEIRRAGEPWTGRHVVVRSRPGSDTRVRAAVFQDLLAGSYDLRLRGSGRDRVHRVVVRGGEVVWHDWESPWPDLPSAGTREPRADVPGEAAVPREEEDSHGG